MQELGTVNTITGGTPTTLNSPFPPSSDDDDNDDDQDESPPSAPVPSHHVLPRQLYHLQRLRLLHSLVHAFSPNRLYLRRSHGSLHNRLLPRRAAALPQRRAA